VKALREKSGAGMMDCKKALAECGGDEALAADLLRKKGLAQAGKKAGRTASDGAIGEYIHTGSRCARRPCRFLLTSPLHFKLYFATSCLANVCVVAILV